jgi:superfamily I DNA/RNA helicase/RecB family exonuclease
MTAMSVRSDQIPGMSTYCLVHSPRTRSEPPLLDGGQQAVVNHAGGPLLVLAGPGTGKTTTLVESVVDRIEVRGLAPEQVLVLTFSRKAAEELRDRISARLGRTTSTLLSSTFHSFCYGLVRRYLSVDAFADPVRLLSAAEQDIRLRELLAGSRASGKVSWPPSVQPALRTKGLAAEVRAALARARDQGLEPADLVAAGNAAGRPEWSALGAFFDEYLDVLDAEGVLDYSELIHRAVLLAQRPEVRRNLRREFAAVFVDEYQDTDPAQVRLLHALSGQGGDLVVFGDPDQSIYAFRGADVQGIMRFPQEFASANGEPAKVIALGTTRRFGDRLLLASRRVATGLGLPGTIDRDTFQVFRNPTAASNRYGPGRIDAMTFSSPGAEVDQVADILRRAHLEDGLCWSQMAVLVRSGVRSISMLRRSLVACGVPVEVAVDELPLRREPAVQPLLLALRACADPSVLTPEVARDLLISPLGGFDAADVRRLARQLREADRACTPGKRLPRPSGVLLSEALADREILATGTGRLARAAHRLAVLLFQGRALVESGAPAEDALWHLWDGTRWPLRLRAAVDRGGAAARLAHRDLDAVCALFELAARAEQRSGHSGVATFLEAVSSQQIPGDTRADRGVRGAAVRLLTAHRSKGLEWPLVVVTGVQEGVWPDLRLRGSLLQPDRLGRDGVVAATTAAGLMGEERRLFYVAVTRARQRLVVTAVASPEPDGDQPSRFLGDLGVEVRPIPGRPARPMSLSGVMGQLRAVSADRHCSPALRRTAAARLARLAAEVDEAGTAMFPHADPASWWGLCELTRAEQPMCAADQPVRLSGSAISKLMDCPLSWFLSREVAADSRGSSAGFGTVIHLLAQAVGHGEHEPDADQLMRRVDEVWEQLQFDAPWVAERERVEAAAAVQRFVTWHLGRPGREVLASERPFDFEVVVGGDRLRLCGAMDRVERDDQGRIVVVDFKTVKRAPGASSLPDDPQLGAYQFAVSRGALADEAGPEPQVGGAELVHLRLDEGGGPKVQSQPPPNAGDDGRTTFEVQLQTAVATIRSERFVARPGPACRYCQFKRMCPARSDGRQVVP